LPKSQKKGAYFYLWEESYPKLHEGMIKKSGGPFNLKNIFFQNESIENTKPGAQIWSHQNLTP